MSQTRQQQAIFPDMPRDRKFLDEEGQITSDWWTFLSQLVLVLQTNFKPEGFVIPPKTASEIASLGNISAAIGNIIYDTTNNVFKGIELVSLNPVVTVTKTFTLT